MMQGPYSKHTLIIKMIVSDSLQIYIWLKPMGQ